MSWNIGEGRFRGEKMRHLGLGVRRCLRPKVHSGPVSIVSLRDIATVAIVGVGAVLSFLQGVRRRQRKHLADRVEPGRSAVPI